jgi:EAL domain-containing protein (putative c-di-GMP-specific phosphodiesterase class I)/ActR/RegA family two-component response regulator
LQLAGLSFLVVEDHDFQRRALATLLSNHGAKVYEAADGHAALKIIQDPARPVDIVISDLEMPGMDGMEFVRRIGESGRRISIILASALEPKLLASVGTMAEAYGVQLLGVVEKPITPAKLEPLIRAHQPGQSERPKAAARKYALDEIAAGLRSDQFEPFFQPKIELATGQVRGAEALARWRHPQHGVVAPFAFIALLEEHGLIDELTWVMLRKAAARCSAWRTAGLEMTVSVNLSLKSLGDTQIAERVTDLVRSQNLEPRHVILEVTESAAAAEVGRALENLARLRMKGFGLSIDDYGTGYSSMQQLTRIAFTELKIDRSFVANAARQESVRVILQSSLDMARKLGIHAVAEGVETQADYDLLRRLGCDLAQGYFVARPMDAEAYLRWVRDAQKTKSTCSSG